MKEWQTYADSIHGYISAWYLASTVDQYEKVDRSTAENWWAQLDVGPPSQHQDIFSELQGGTGVRSQAFLRMGQLLVTKEQAVVEDLLAADPAGFSTSRSDLLKDLLP